MSETVVLIIVALFVIMTVLGLILGLISWLFPIAARLVISFTVFLMELPFILTLLVFILFPPTLIVFLVGFVLLRLGLGDDSRDRRS